MLQKYNLGIAALGIGLIATSLFLPWSEQPKYSVFKIADYSTTYSAYFTIARILSTISILLIVLVCLTFISLAFKRLAMYCTFIFGIYCVGYVIYTAIVIEKMNFNSSLISKTSGPSIAVFGAVLVLYYSISEFKQRKNNG